MIDLAKLEEKIDSLLGSETNESLLSWYSQFENEHFKGFEFDEKVILDQVSSVVYSEEENEKYSTQDAENTDCSDIYRLAA